jgi:hypothetical protein
MHARTTERLERSADDVFQLSVSSGQAVLMHCPTGSTVTWFPKDDQAVKDGARMAYPFLLSLVKAVEMDHYHIR